MTSPGPRWATPRALAFVALVALLALAATPAAASSGDRHGTFQMCHIMCQTSQCQGPGAVALPWWLRVARWTCADNCAYQCGHRLTNESDAGHEYYHQFFGKWAFYRLGPIQEPMSVLMSLGNLYVHYLGLRRVRRTVRKENVLRPWLEALAYIQINTWTWSSVFHTRDVPITERLDYFSAMITIASTLFFAAARIFGFIGPRGWTPGLLPLGGAITLFVLGHFWYVTSLPRFPYGYHVAVAVVLGVVHNLLWLLWSASFAVRIPGWPAAYPRRGGAAGAGAGAPAPRNAYTPAVLVAVSMAAMGLELFDFPPWLRIVDAHSLWHAATIPLAAVWWNFMCADAIELDRVAVGKE